MKERYKDKYRSSSLRLAEYDYRSPGWYFITICTHSRTPYFGQIENGIVGLSNVGIRAHQNWQGIPNHFEQVILDEFIIMPNHLHGLIGIKAVETGHGLSLQQENLNQFSKVVPGSISVIINQFKGSVTRWCRKNHYPRFKWQSNYYEHIVRNEASLNRIRTYIYDNPLKWDQDDYYIS